MAASTEATASLPPGRGRGASGLNTSGYATKQLATPRFTRLAPRARSPPSAKKSACTKSTEARTRKPALGPSSTARRRPPPRWPDEPVPGIEKFTI